VRPDNSQSAAAVTLSSTVRSLVRRLSHVLLTIEAIILVFPTFLAAMVLFAGSFSVWADLWTHGRIFDAFAWTVMFLSLVAAWWLLLTYFYGGQQAARDVPAAVWIFAALISILSSIGFVSDADSSVIKAFSPGFLFVPTFIHLSLEVWIFRPDTSRELTRES
jgi:hypothetical protein